MNHQTACMGFAHRSTKHFPKSNGADGLMTPIGEPRAETVAGAERFEGLRELRELRELRGDGAGQGGGQGSFNSPGPRPAPSGGSNRKQGSPT